MSTRCVIGYEGESALIYRHSDGYPDGKTGVLAALEPFRDHFFRGRGNDGAFFLARVLAWMPGYNREEYTGFGVCTGFPFDIAYYYHIRISGDIEVYATTTDVETAQAGAPGYSVHPGFELLRTSKRRRK